jgi:hypothetical protein
MGNEWYLTAERPPTMQDFASQEDIDHESKFEHVKGLSGEVEVSYDNDRGLVLEAEVYFPLHGGFVRWEKHVTGYGVKIISAPVWWRKK